MIIRISHETVYRYAPPARSAIQLVRLTPADYWRQHIRTWRLDVDPNVRRFESRDWLGNVCHIFNVDGPISRLAIAVEGEVETSDGAGVVGGAFEPFPPELFLRETSLTRADPALTKLALEVEGGGTRDRLATLHDLARALYSRIRFEPGWTHAATPAATAFEQGRGVCQDFAHMFIAAARTLEIPARYVSGYLARADGVATQEAGHAWAEAYVDDLGWVGFDPANGVSPTEAYVRVAIGLDYLGAAPVLGARNGGGAEGLVVALKVEAETRQSQA